MTDWIQALGATGTLVIAVATLVIARRQTSIADATRELTEAGVRAAQFQAESSATQMELSARLTRLEESRETPVLIPTHVRLSLGELTGTVDITIENVGGGAAWALNLSGVTIFRFARDGQATRHNLGAIGLRVPICRDGCEVAIPVQKRPGFAGGELFDFSPDSTLELVVFAMCGYFLSPQGPRELRYEGLPGMVDQLLATPGFAKLHMDAQSWVTASANEGT